MAVDVTTAAVLERIGEPLRLRTLRIPALRPGQVLVEVAWSGVCGSQVLEVDGGRGEDRYLPHGLGHEGSGTVLAVGDGVTKVRAGDHVVLTWIKGSGADVSGTVYESAEGPVNSGAVITFARHAVVSENRVVPIPPSMPFREAALLGCAVPTGVGSVVHTGGAQAGSTVAIFGVGGVGLAAVMGARLAHAEMVVAVDVRTSTLERARYLGATHTVDATREDALAAVRTLTGGRGVDIAIEAAGRETTMEAAFQATRDGGVCVIAGNPSAGVRIAIDPMALIRGRRIVGTWGGDTRPDRDIPPYVSAFQAGELPLGHLAGGEFSLADVNEAIDALRRGGTGRPLIDLSR